MALPSVVQIADAVVVSSLSAGQLTLGVNVTPGNSLLGVATAGNSRTWTVTDTQDAGSWSLTVRLQTGNGSVEIDHRHSCSGGTAIITWTVNTSTFSGIVWALEVSGLDAAATPQTGSLNESPTVSDDHHATGSNLTGTDVLAIVAGVLDAAAGGTSAGTGYTIAPTLSSTRHLAQYRVTAALNDRGPWHSTGTDRAAMSAMAVFPAPAAADPKVWWLRG